MLIDWPLQHGTADFIGLIWSRRNLLLASFRMEKKGQNWGPSKIEPSGYLQALSWGQMPLKTGQGQYVAWLIGDPGY